MELSPTAKSGLHTSREDRRRQGQGRRNQSITSETDILYWQPHQHHQQNSRKSSRTWHETAPKGYGPGQPRADDKRRARPPPQLPQPPKPSSPPFYPSLHFHHPPPPPPPPPPPAPLPPAITWHAISSECHGQHYSCNPNSGETCWEHPKSKGTRVTSHPPAASDADSKRGISPGKPRPAEILSKNGKVQDKYVAAMWRCRRRENTAAANPAEDTLLSQANLRRNNEGSGNLPREINPCYTTAKLPYQDKVTGPDASTQQGACLKPYRQAPATRRVSAPSAKRPCDPLAVAGGCGVGGGLGGQTCGEHTKRRARRKQQTRVQQAPPVASRHDEQTEPNGRRPLRQLQLTGKNSSVSRCSPSRRGSCIADYLSLAEDWLAESKTERLQSRTNHPGQRTSPLNAAHSLGDSALSQLTTSLGDQGRPEELKTRGTTARLRGKAAAEWAAGEARRRDEEQMTGKPEITRLGRSKRRSVDDLFLFKRTADTARRQKQDDSVAQEDIFVTGRPELNTRSKLLAERMSRNRKGAHLSASQRLHGDALEQRRRIENRRTRVETAARRRANPNLPARSRAVPRNRGDVARRLYEQALSRREDALERERLALAAPQGGTFRPVIAQRSVRLARRRREGWGLGSGVGVSGRGGGLIEDALLAEGVVYERRRQERQARREQLDEVLRQNLAPSRHSKRLLLEIERRGNAKGTQLFSGQGGRLPASEASTAGDGGVDRNGFKSALEALQTSKRMLESRYGSGPVPSMAQRAKEREMKSKERAAQLVEQEKENDGFAAKRAIQHLGGSQISGRRRRSVGVAGDVGCGGDIYERTTESNTRKEKRRAAELQARLEEEISGCTFAPDLRPSRRGTSLRQTKGKNTSIASATPGGERRMGKDVTAGGRLSGGRSLTRRGNLHQANVNCAGGEAEGIFENGDGNVWTSGGVPTADSGIPTAHGREATIGVDDDTRPLPDNWSVFVTPEGREYFFDARRDVVQWERPTG